MTPTDTPSLNAVAEATPEQMAAAMDQQAAAPAPDPSTDLSAPAPAADPTAAAPDPAADPNAQAAPDQATPDQAGLAAVGTDPADTGAVADTSAPDPMGVDDNGDASASMGQMGVSDPSGANADSGDTGYSGSNSEYGGATDQGGYGDASDAGGDSSSGGLGGGEDGGGGGGNGGGEDSGGAGNGGDSGDGTPVILDLTGKGIKITPLSSSNTFVKLGQDGYANRTAWAGAGDAVLFLDPGNTGKVSQGNQVAFTDWDPTASSDMQALRDVFDTNHDGKLDAGDAAFGNFKLMVTNADGTSGVETLAQAGITSINLVPTDASVKQVDGSTVTGRAAYTKTDGSTGTAADVSLAYDANGFLVKQATTHNADGSTTIDNKAYNASGDLANDTTSTTSANGLSTSLTYDANGDGVIDGKETDVTAVNPNGFSNLVAMSSTVMPASHRSGRLCHNVTKPSPVTLGSGRNRQFVLGRRSEVECLSQPWGRDPAYSMAHGTSFGSRHYGHKYDRHADDLSHGQTADFFRRRREKRLARATGASLCELVIRGK